MRQRIGRALLIVVATVALSVLVNQAISFRNSPSTTQSKTESNFPSVRLAPAKLFAGDLERLRPHLRLTATGFFQAEITGPSVMIGSDLELWRDGKKRKGLGGGFARTSGPAELSFSLKEVAGSDGKKKFNLVCAVTGPTGGSSSTELDQPELSGTKMSGTAEISEPVTLPENESVPIWAYLVHNDLKHPVTSPIQEAVKNSRWALLVKARWYRPDDAK